MSRSGVDLEQQSVQSLLRSAHQTFVEKGAASAASELRQGIDGRSPDKKATLSLGWYLYKAGDFEGGERHVLSAIKMGAPIASDWFLLGNIREEAGNITGALEATREAHRLDPNEVRYSNWVSKYHRQLGNDDAATAAVHASASRLGWMLPQERELSFAAEPWFLTHINNWTKHLDAFLGRSEAVLEIGSMEGMSTLWIAERLLSKTGQLYANDIVFRPAFLENVEKSGLKDRIVKLEGSSGDILPPMPAEQFDFIYVDGDHSGSAVIRDAANAIRLIRPYGVVIFDDYGKSNQTGGRGLDCILELFDDAFVIVEKQYQVILRRNSGSLKLNAAGVENLARLLDEPAAAKCRELAGSPEGMLDWLRHGGAVTA